MSPPTFYELNDIHSLCVAQIWSIWTYTESTRSALITKHILYRHTLVHICVHVLKKKEYIFIIMQIY